MSFRVIREMPVTALACLPILTLPALLGALVWAIFPEWNGGWVILVLSAATLAWYLLGGAIAIWHILHGIALRREIRALNEHLSDPQRPTLIVSTDGTVHKQNSPALPLLGDLVGRHVQDIVLHHHAQPDAFWHDLIAELDRKGTATVELAPLSRFEVTRKAGAGAQLWQGIAEKPLASPLPQPAPGTEFNDLPVALLLLDEKAHIKKANIAAQEMLGVELEGKPLSTFLDGPGRPLGDWVADACAGRSNSGPEVLRIRRTGSEQFVQVNLKSGNDCCITAVLSDANDLKRLEAQFVQSQKMQAIGQLAGGVAHDFNNLLTAISGHCDLLMLRHDKGDPDYADLEQINQNTNRAAALVGQLLAYSRKQTLRLQTVDLRDTLSELTYLLNRLVGEPVVLTFNHDPKLAMIRADKRQLEQVIINIVVNARDAMPGGGNITITTRNIDITADKPPGCTIMPEGTYVCVEVQDEGFGIPPEIVSRVFEPFFSTKKTGEGTGLGLSTVYGIVKQTGGYIFCDSVPNEGTRFTLYFPAHAAIATESETAPSETKSVRQVVAQGNSEPSVLLVEDESSVRAFASRALQLQGCNVLEAASAEEALDLLSDQSLCVDIFVTDVVMPGMDGPTWVRTALRDRPSTKVIFMSGYAEDIFSEGSAHIPEAVFLAKPFSLSDLTSLVDRQLAQT